MGYEQISAPDHKINALQKNKSDNHRENSGVLRCDIIAKPLRMRSEKERNTALNRSQSGPAKRTDAQLSNVAGVGCNNRLAMGPRNF